TRSCCSSSATASSPTTTACACRSACATPTSTRSACCRWTCCSAGAKAGARTRTCCARWCPPSTASRRGCRTPAEATGATRVAAKAYRRLPLTRGEPNVSNSELVFHTNPMSRGRIVRWMLEELGVEYRAVVQEYGASMKSPGYLAINPMGKVPALQHRGIVVTEAAAICAYLADAFPQAGLAPALDDPLRGPYLRWMFFAAGPVEAAVTAKSLGALALPDKAAMAGYG